MVWDKVGRCRRPPALPSLSSCPDLFRVSTSLGRFVRSRLTPRCRKTWMPGTSPLLSGSVVRGLRADGLGQGRAVSASSGTPPPLVVMPGLVPGIHAFPPVRPLPVRTATPQDVDTRNKSGHDGGRDAEVPKSVSRVARSFGNPLLSVPFFRPAKSKPDSNGLVPGMTIWGQARRRSRRRSAPADCPSSYLYKPRHL